MLIVTWFNEIAMPPLADNHNGVPARDPQGHSRRLGRLGRSGVFALSLALGLLAAGFIWFVWRVPADEVTMSGEADAIVALTGGASRIADAIELLASGRGQRLLISGANRSTTAQEISRIKPEFARWVRCCVDFDRSLNTFGNALEIRRWVEERGFRSLIVVTSNYHMPRALAEIGYQLPDVALVPFPVVTERQRSEPWWSNGATARLMVSEYLKLIFAHIRMGFIGIGATGEPDSSRAELKGRPA
jgi:uncharacterized SAM-binding protein YcdF (DUF218 family)